MENEHYILHPIELIYEGNIYEGNIYEEIFMDQSDWMQCSGYPCSAQDIPLVLRISP